MLNKKNLYKKASSLIEVIIVLAIVSFTIIASMALVARTRLEIKNNEIQDKGNEVMLKALEALKAPTKVLISGNVNFSIPTTYYFSMQTDASGNYILKYQPPTFFTALPTDNETFNFNEVCKADNVFYMTDGGTFNYCQQVTIKPILRQGITRELYEVSTRIIYVTSSGSKSESLTSYRYEGFKKQTP